MSRLRWTLFDYGVGNLHSLRKALEQHVDVDVTEDPEALRKAQAIVLPGVGAFGPVMERLEPARAAIQEHVAADRPLLGVCIGMQVLYEGSEEAPDVAGLAVLPGQVQHLDPSAGKVPHMGWNQLSAVHDRDPLDEVLAGAGHVYYVHSYAAPPGPDALATTTYGRPFAAAVRRGRTLGFQFHPEKSSAAGKAILGAALRSLEET